MNFKSKKTSLIILGITSIVCSRIMFAFIDDPEGPNLLIVMVLAGILFALSLLAYKIPFSITNRVKLEVAILIQIVVVIILNLFLN